MGFLSSFRLLASRDYDNLGRYYEHSLREGMAKKAAEDAKKNKLQPDRVEPSGTRKLVDTLPPVMTLQNALTPPQSHR